LFKAQANNDVCVAFFGSQQSRSSAAIEVVIGAAGDTQSVIRQGTQVRVAC